MATLVQSIGPVNSTSYADVAGLYAGLDRIPGETTDQYLERLDRSTVELRDATYAGLVNEISLQLGLKTQPGIMIQGPDNSTISCDLAGLHLVAAQNKVTCPLLTLDKDDVWKWNSLSNIVMQVSQTGVWTATLLVDDGPAVQLCRQSNAGLPMPYECVVSEVGLIGLTEPSLPAIAATPSGGLAYQVREFLQAIVQIDRSYWAR